ncbi:winged helix-turn-helix transcriptional regulator [Microbacterium sp. SORGH_AS_0888]|uniref:winged helix-turn-helix transcriptional regulator n=1 Tax=Microbacterium sp. SORGH_AS_0888 TaxID=3041791 RepID=UPI002784828D|nr:helix-turn-helix domain-containing protein [Microbacterium sp. SORGH_AS_0888]MDQ1130811.1 putative ArsR family transcriptional regulator [Microbacterium sp. SORGH_AS_0888]
MAAYSAISSYSRVQLLHLLQGRPQRSIAELCEATGLHANTVREHMQRLIDGGYVVAETEKRTVRGRPRVLYSAASPDEASPIAQRKARDAARRGDLMRRVLPGAHAAGLPTEALHQLDALTDDLGDAGFDPLVDESALTVDLSPCPHGTATDADRRVLCHVHLGLMDGVLAQAGGPLRVAGMAPSCDPTQCVVRLAG